MGLSARLRPETDRRTTSSDQTRAEKQQRSSTAGPRRRDVGATARASARPGGTPGRATGARSGAGRRASRSASTAAPRATSSAPPRHSVTSSPVNSMCTPPGQTPSCQHAAKNPSISRMIASKRRVLHAARRRGSCSRASGRTPTRRDALRRAPRAGAAAAARATRSAPMRAINVSRPGTRSGFSRSHELDDLLGRRRRPELHAERVVDAGEELDVRAVELPRALADPEQVRRAVVPVAGQRVAARQRPPRSRAAAPRGSCRRRPGAAAALGREVDPARGHEARARARSRSASCLVAPALGRASRRTPGSRVHLRQVGEAALRERAQQVQRRRPTGGSPRASARGSGTRASAVGSSSCTMWPRNDGSSTSSDALERRRARLGELPGDPPHLHHRQRRAVGEHGRHLQEDLQLLADPHRRELVERLDAVAGLEQERAPVDDLRERSRSCRASPAKTSGGDAFSRASGRRGRVGVGPLGLLERPGSRQEEGLQVRM